MTTAIMRRRLLCSTLVYIHLLMCHTVASMLYTTNISYLIPKPDVLQLVESYHELCPFTQLCRVPFVNTEGILVDGALPCCESCLCSTTSDCHAHNACCPDELPRLLGAQEIRDILDEPVECMFMQYIPHGEAKLDWLTLDLVAKCPASFEDKDLKRKCERNFIEFDFNENPSGFAPVEDTSTKTIYRNKHCAECHGFTDDNIEQWRTEMFCHNFESVILNSMRNIVEEIGFKKCNVIFQKPRIFSGIDSRSCTYVIDRCNVTGRWQSYDSSLEASCLSYTSIYRKHKNVHCFLCNGHEISEITDNRMCSLDNKNWYTAMPFSATIDIDRLADTYGIARKHESGNLPPSDCSAGDRKAPNTKPCLSLHCPAMMFLSGQTCVPFYSKVQMCFYVRFRLVPRHDANINITALTLLGDKIKESLETPHISKFDFVLKLDKGLDDISTETVNQTRLLYIDVRRMMYLATSNTTATFEDFTELYDIEQNGLGEFSKEFVAKEDEIFNPNAPIVEPQFLIYDTDAFETPLYVAHDRPDLLTLVNTHFTGQDFGCTAVLYITPRQFCPKVVLDRTEFKREVDEDGRLKVTLRGKDVNVTDVLFFEGYNKVMVCQDEIPEERRPVLAAGCLHVNIFLLIIGSCHIRLI